MRTGTVSYRLEDLKNRVIIPIGFVGENDFTRVIFDAEEIYKKYPNASVSMKVQPPKGGIYPATVTRDGNTVIWQVKEADVANRGGGELQLTFTDGETKIKTYIARTDVKRSLAGNGPAPDPVQGWIDEANATLAEVEQALEDIPESIEAALEAAKESGEFDGPPGPPGEDGKDGRDGVDGKDGKDGQDGAPGHDGKDGKDGQDGRDGTDGTNGTDGEDGTTFTPLVSSAGVLSWTNDGEKQNPQPVDIAAAVRGSIDETVAGQNPVIAGEANHRYLCGEVQTISITPPQTGIIDVVFTSGTTPTILTVPNTVKFSGDFDPSALEASTTYEINIMDGIYGAVLAWT